MALARALDGVISGEHGIGITKLEFLTDEETRAVRATTSSASTREGRFNKGKLLRAAGAAGRPAQRLHAELRPDGPRVADHAAERHRRDRRLDQGLPALRQVQAGRARPTCRAPTCSTAPRNKILATSLLIEAFLYEEQTRRGVSIKHWDEFEDVADHCTVCHKCVTPCPVDIDFGDVSMNMRNLLRKMGKKTLPSRQRGGDVLPERDRPGRRSS